MKSYLQRLAVRAKGHALSPSLIPTMRSETTHKSEADPFAAALESYESPEAQSPRAVSGPQVTSNAARVTSTIEYESETNERPAPVASAPRSRRHKRSQAEETLQQTVETQSASPKSGVESRQPETSSREIDSGARPEGETRKSRDKTLARAKQAQSQGASPDEKNDLTPSRQDEARNARDRSFTSLREIGDKTESRQLNGLPRDVFQQLRPYVENPVRSTARSPVMPAHLTDEQAPTLEPRRADAVQIEARSPSLSDEPVQTLEPRAAVNAPAAPIPDAPRLVIGQLRVDVVAAAPGQPREVVRVVTRTVGAGRSSNTGGSLSKLRFGLGQM